MTDTEILDALQESMDARADVTDEERRKRVPSYEAEFGWIVASMTPGRHQNLREVLIAAIERRNEIIVNQVAQGLRK